MNGKQIQTAGYKVAQGYCAAGVHEVGGNNRGDQVEFFLRMVGTAAGEPWCAAFVSTCLVKGWANLLGLPADRAALLGYVPRFKREVFGISGYCPDLWKEAKLRGFAVDRHEAPREGDIVLYDLKEQGAPHHVEWVKAYSRGLLTTIGGNTPSGQAGSQGDGDGVFVRHRGTDKVFGYVRFK